MLKEVTITDLKAVPKPRQTKSDKWKQRPSVVAYRAFADGLRRQCGDVPSDVTELEVKFFIKMPDSWSQKKRNEHEGRGHRQTPDIDNLLKAVMDALFLRDAHIYKVSAIKMWATYDKISIGMF